MRKEIRYNGYSAVPSDYECLDGDLSCALGMVQEDGGLKMIEEAEKKLKLLTGFRPLYLFKAGGISYVFSVEETTRQEVSGFILNARSLTASATEYGQYFYDRMDDQGHYIPFSFDTYGHVTQITSIGNIVIVLTTKGKYYIVFRAGEGFEWIGGSIPELRMSFGLQGHPETPMEDNNPYAWIITLADTNPDTDALTNLLLAKVNKYIADEVNGRGRFVFPFFVRYALRLFDGSLVHHSAPVLMKPSSPTTMDGGIQPVILSATPSLSVGHTIYGGSLFAIPCDLDYCYFGTIPNKWRDIVTSVDIFISAPFYTFDPTGKCTGDIDGNEASSGYTSSKIGDDYWNRCRKSDVYSITGTGVSYNRFLLPPKHDDSIRESINSCGNFYLVKSIPVSEMTNVGTRTILPISGDILDNLVTLEAMTDDYDSHDELIASNAHSYNQRLNLCGITKKLFNGFSFAEAVSYYNHLNTGETSANYDTYVYLHTDEGDKVVKATFSLSFGSGRPWQFFFYYPSTRAYRLLLNDTTGNVWYEGELRPHPTLNGAYCDSVTTMATAPTVTVSEATLQLPNKVYTSEVGNPFYFPLEGINTVGVGRIIGMATAAKALSQGQFGQFPLYCFTDEGVWAMEVNDHGLYSSKQVITRDVCLDVDSITEMDNAVLFASDRGIMVLGGSESVCLSEELDNAELFDVLCLPGMDRLEVVQDMAEQVPFKEYLHGVRMLYDYVHQRIIVYNPAYGYAYVYSLKSKSWGMMESSIGGHLNGYPAALAYTLTENDGTFVATIVDYSADGGIPAADGLLVTRPLKLGAPDTLKTVSALVQRGYFRKCHVKTVLYGSRDLFHWHLVSSSVNSYLRGFSGTPYKYFRVVAVCCLEKGESVWGCTVEYKERMMNRLR